MPHARCDLQLPGTGKGPILVAADSPNSGNVSKTAEREDHMKRLTRRTILAAPTALALGGPLLAPWPARAKNYGPGVSDSEIKIGNTAPYSGPLSNASPIPLTMAAYFKMINDQG